MPSSHLPSLLATAFLNLARWLQRRSAVRLPVLLCGLLFARGRRTVTSSLRAAGITPARSPGPPGIPPAPRPPPPPAAPPGRQPSHMAPSVQSAVRPLRAPQRLLVGIDDTPPSRYGPCVEGCGIHHNPSPGPAG